MLKAVLILLMVAFHLVWFEHLHSYAKQVVCTFHMPGFLIISGYLMINNIKSRLTTTSRSPGSC